MKLKIRLEYSDKISCFELKLFFQRPLENFLWTLRTCSRYLKGPPNLDLCVSKKITTIRHVDRKIFEKNKNRAPKIKVPWAPLYVYWFRSVLLVLIDVFPAKNHIPGRFRSNYHFLKITIFSIFLNDFR